MNTFKNHMDSTYICIKIFCILNLSQLKFVYQRRKIFFKRKSSKIIIHAGTRYFVWTLLVVMDLFDLYLPPIIRLL